MTSWLVLQLADSAFPTGGFAHSASLEAHVQAGELPSLVQFCREQIDQLAHGSLPWLCYRDRAYGHSSLTLVEGDTHAPGANAGGRAQVFVGVEEVELAVDLCLELRLRFVVSDANVIGSHRAVEYATFGSAQC